MNSCEGDELVFVEGERNLALKAGSSHPERWVKK
jgi:hypothetical protein